MIGRGVNGSLIALSAVIPRGCVRLANCAYALASRGFPARSAQLGDHLHTSAPGRSRTDTGDPFRGPASSLGLRGLGNNTPERLSDSRAAELIQNVSPGGSYLFSLGRRMQSVTISIKFDGVCLRSVTTWSACGRRTQAGQPASSLEDRIQHARGDPASERVLLTRVITTHQDRRGPGYGRGPGGHAAAGYGRGPGDLGRGRGRARAGRPDPRATSTPCPKRGRGRGTW